MYRRSLTGKYATALAGDGESFLPGGCAPGAARVMRIDQAQQSSGMSAFDAFLYRGDDDPHSRAIFAVACVLDRSPGRRRFINAFDRASRAIPRLRQRVVSPAVPLLLPWWVVDPEFDLGFHLRFGRLPGPGSMQELLDASQAEVTAPLDADRPLWEALLLEGLEGNRAAVIVRLSHALTDSVGPSELLAALLDSSRSPRKGPMPPAPRPQFVTPEELLDLSLANLPAAALDGARRLAGTLGSVRNLGATLSEALDFAQSLGRVLGSAGPSSPLLAGRSLRRRCAAFDVGLTELERAGRAAGASVSDVYLGCIAASLERYHDELGAPVDKLPVAIPVGLRDSGTAAGGTHFGAILIAAPLTARTVARRLELMSRILREGLEEPATGVLGVIAPVLARLPGPMLRALTGSLPRPDILAGSFQGPARPAYFAGAKVLKAYAFGPAPGVAAMFTMQSVGSGACVSVNYDPAAITRSDLFANCLGEGFAETLRVGARKPRLGPITVGRMRDQEMAA
jgi:diacylglycerol O-acyltransferase